MTTSPKSIWFYGASSAFKREVEARFDLKVSEPTTGHHAVIVEIPSLDKFYAVRDLVQKMG